MVRIFHYSLPLLTSFLLYASFDPLNALPLAWVALIPLAIFIKREKRLLVVLIMSFLSGYVFFTAGFWWLTHVAFIGPFLLAIYKAIYFLLFALCVRFSNKFVIPVGSCSWVALEYIRGSLGGASLPWFLLGHTQIDFFYLIQIADIFGTYFISFPVIFFNLMVADWLLTKKPPKTSVAIFCAVITCCITYSVLRVNGIKMYDGPKILIIQPNIPQAVKEQKKDLFEIYKKHLELTRKGLEESQVHIIIWPEASFLYPIYFDKKSNSYVQDIYYDLLSTPSELHNVKFLIGTSIYEIGSNDSTVYNSACYIDPAKGITGRYDKAHLVPFGEYIPLAGSFPFIRRLVIKYSELSGFTDHGAGKTFDLFWLGDTRFGTIICFEGILPWLSRQYARKGAGFLVNISNDGWFKASPELEQILNIVRFRAIENRVCMVRATNTGISAVISPSGRVEKFYSDPQIEATKEVEGYLTGTLMLTDSKSIYRIIGDTFAVVCLFATMGYLLTRISGFYKF